MTIRADCHKVSIAVPHSKGGRGRTWSPEEDAAIRAAALDNARFGLTGFDLADIHAGRRSINEPYSARLRHVAEAIGRTYGAVRKRAERIGATSYRTRKGEAKR